MFALPPETEHGRATQRDKAEVTVREGGAKADFARFQHRVSNPVEPTGGTNPVEPIRPAREQDGGTKTAGGSMVRGEGRKIRRRYEMTLRPTALAAAAMLALL